MYLGELLFQSKYTLTDMGWQIVIKKPWGTFVTNVHKSPEFGYLLKIKDPENIEPYKPYYLQVNFHESEILFRQLLPQNDV